MIGFAQGRKKTSPVYEDVLYLFLLKAYFALAVARLTTALKASG